MAGIQTIEEEYFRVGFSKRILNRVTWLVILVVAATISQTILKRYAGVLGSMLALTYFIPMLTGSGGNTGSQSSTLVIRALATGEIKLKDWWRILLRESKVGVSLGFIMGLIAFTIAYISLGQFYPGDDGRCFLMDGGERWERHRPGDPALFPVCEAGPRIRIRPAHRYVTGRHGIGYLF